MAARAAVEVEARAQTGANGVRLLEVVAASVEYVDLTGRESRQRSAGAGRAAARAGIVRDELGWSLTRCQQHGDTERQQPRAFCHARPPPDGCVDRRDGGAMDMPDLERCESEK